MNNSTNKILDAIVKIYEKMEGSKLKDESLLYCKAELKIVEEYLNCSEIQAALFSIFFGLENKLNTYVDISILGEYVDESFLYLLKFIKEIKTLEKRSFLHEKVFDEEFKKYCVDKKVFDCIVEGRNLDYKIEIEDDEVLYELYEQIFNYKNRNIEQRQYIKNIRAIEADNFENEIIKNVIKTYPENLNARIIAYSLCYRVVNGGDYQEDEDECDGFDCRILPARNLLTVKKELSERSYCMITDGIIQIRLDLNSNWGPRRHSVSKVLSLTQKGIDTFFGKDAKKYQAEYVDGSESTQLKQFLLEFGNIYEATRSVTIKRNELIETENKYKELKIVKMFRKLIKESDERFIMYSCSNDFINFSGESSLVKTLKDIYGDGAPYFAKVHEYKDEKAPLVKEGFLNIEKAETINKTKLELGDRTIELIYGNDADLFRKSVNDSNIIVPEKLKDKTLFYPSEVIDQITLLKESLKEENLIKMKKRLEEKSLPKGIAALLYGAPGTGKTESVYQIAKATNRKIYHVDISETKSMWFGESEKKIKKIFTCYRNLCDFANRHNENTPILLFNEADAIISKRKDVTSGNVAQTENAIQNIILEQMEGLEGIMIATTNLCENMDAAFERRFLFKIKFDKPGIVERSKIWKDKMPWMSEDESRIVAEEYDFSGGEIDNIVRKCEIDEVITGDIPNLDKILELCKNERLESGNTRTIGFEI